MNTEPLKSIAAYCLVCLIQQTAMDKLDAAQDFEKVGAFIVMAVDVMESGEDAASSAIGMLRNTKAYCNICSLEQKINGNEVASKDFAQVAEMIRLYLSADENGPEESKGGLGALVELLAALIE